MKQFNMIDLRKDWEQLPTPELEGMLRDELEKKVPDDDIVLLLLHILEEREAAAPLELTERERKAAERYRQRVSSRKKKPVFFSRWLSVAASMVLILGLLIAVVPQRAEAETFWEMLQRLSNTVISYFSGEGRLVDVEYTFETDNPGLQQVYDAVVDLEVTEPVVPMWLPDGAELTSLSPKNTPMLKGVWATFSDGAGEIIFKLDIYDGEPAHQYYKDDTHYESYELEGTTYNITRNNERWVVVWMKENIECSITLDCQEETLRRILNSIYVMEDNE